MGRDESAEPIFFDRFRLDRHGLFQLDRDGTAAPVGIGSRALELLRVLVARPGEIVTKDAIMAAVWPGTVVEEGNLTVQISTLRRIFEKGGAAGGAIQTIPGRGYRFASAVAGEGAGMPDKPSIAVLPFQNLSGEPDQAYFADGIVEEIITALCRIRWLFVIARNSSFVYRGDAVDVRRVGRELGVRYVLEGSVRKDRERVRITAQLIEAATGAHLWAERFDGGLDDIFALQDKVAASVAGIIEPTVQAAERDRGANRPPRDLTTHDLYLRAYAMYFASATEIPEALSLLEQAIARDPRHGPALAWAAVCCLRLAEDRPEDPRGDARRSVDFARRALAASPDDPRVIAASALALGYFGEDIAAMIALIDRALALNPSFSYGWRVSAGLRLWSGQSDAAIDHIETALRFDPRAHLARPYLIVGAAHAIRRRFDEAIAKLLVAIEADPSATEPYRYLAAAYAHSGRLAEARATIARLRRVTSVVDRGMGGLRVAAERDFILAGLRAAMSGAG